MRRLALFAIKFYQKTLSPDHGIFSFLHPNGYCRFYPTCSSFGLSAISEHGLLKGGFFTVKRVFSCHPWSKGGFDPVPPRVGTDKKQL